ncbi:TPA: Flp pilus assembly complex ATPase component, partial [Klebsiella pneumoniae]|nr:Flp pilus assembly complex ATPase component [Klebsiella pneumoniae]
MNQSSAYYQLGPLREYFEDPGVFEIRINRYNEVVCDTFEGRKIIQNDSITGAFIDNLTAALTSANDVKRQMINDVVLPDGSRGIICLPPAVIDNTAAIAFRKNIALDKDLATLSKEGIFEFCREIDSHKRELDDDDLLLKELYRAKRREEFLLTAVRKKRTVVVVGETGSGKTVLTRALLKAISPQERVIIMEDAHEVEATHLEEAVYMKYGGKDKPGLATPTQCL